MDPVAWTRLLDGPFLLAPRQVRAHVFALKAKNRLDSLKLCNGNFPFLKPATND